MIEKHGMTGTRFYKIWVYMKRRCTNPNRKDSKYYVGKGIKVCDEWASFIQFKKDMYESYLEHCKLYGEKDTSIDRIENDKNYSKENCRWATMKIQTKNRNYAMNRYSKKRKVKARNNEMFKAVSPEGNIFYSNEQMEFSREHNLDQSHVSKCLLGKYKSHKGWKFEYVKHINNGRNI